MPTSIPIETSVGVRSSFTCDTEFRVDIGPEHASDLLIKPIDCSNWPQILAPQLLQILRSDEVWRALPTETQKRILALLEATKPLKRYVRPVVITPTANGTIDSVIGIQAVGSSTRSSQKIKKQTP